MGELRVVSLPLMIGLVTIPVVFVWVLFLPGYTRSTRNAALAYLLIPPALGIVASALAIL